MPSADPSDDLSDDRARPRSDLQSEARTEPRSLIASLFRRGVALDLQTIDLCFLAALSLRADRTGAASFQEDELFDVFEQVAELGASTTAEPAKKRGSHVVRRLREQKLLVRVDGAGVLRAGEYALSRLASAVVGFFLEDEALTRESLTILSASLVSCLEAVAVAARSATTEDAWRHTVTAPLRVTLFDLVSGIERRQRGFDLQQEEFQRAIGALLAADWFGAVERCTALLETTSATLRELNEILLGHGPRLGELLHEVQELAASAARDDAELAAKSAAEHVDRVAAWGGARQRAWSDYHDWVHRYLRDVVRLDPSRTLVHRLREQLAGRGAKAYSLTVASAPPMKLLRPAHVEPPHVPVRRPKKERDVEPELTTPRDPDAALEASMRRALEEGATGLAAVTERATEGHELDDRFQTAGKVAQILPRLATVRAPRERVWTPAGDGLLVEEWPIEREETGS